MDDYGFSPRVDILMGLSISLELEGIGRYILELLGRAGIYLRETKVGSRAF